MVRALSDGSPTALVRGGIVPTDRIGQIAEVRALVMLSTRITTLRLSG